MSYAVLDDMKSEGFMYSPEGELPKLNTRTFTAIVNIGDREEEVDFITQFPNDDRFWIKRPFPYINDWTDYFIENGVWYRAGKF